MKNLSLNNTSSTLVRTRQMIRTMPTNCPASANRAFLSLSFPFLFLSFLFFFLSSFLTARKTVFGLFCFYIGRASSLANGGVFADQRYSCAQSESILKDFAEFSRIPTVRWTGMKGKVGVGYAQRYFVRHNAARRRCTAAPVKHSQSIVSCFTLHGVRSNSVPTFCVLHLSCGLSSFSHITDNQSESYAVS